MIATYKRFGFVLVLVTATALLGGCGDDSSDEGGTSGTGATGGSGGSTGGSGGSTGGSGGSTGGSGGSTGGSGGSTGGSGGTPAFTEAECIAMTNTAMPMVPDTCAPCLCGVDTGVAQCNANCWALIGCAGAACGALPQAEQQGCVSTMCGTQIMQPGAAVGASELGQAMMMCRSECSGGGGDEDGGI
jgi:hypothetical protein